MLVYTGMRIDISIHALREEGDGQNGMSSSVTSIFLSTPSARRATGAVGLNLGVIDFYPRPPRGGRRYAALHVTRSRYFYPRPPRGGRLLRMLSHRRMRWAFLSTPSARRATGVAMDSSFIGYISIHALREEGDFRPAHPRAGRENISIHALREEGDERRHTNV